MEMWVPLNMREKKGKQIDRNIKPVRKREQNILSDPNKECEHFWLLNNKHSKVTAFLGFLTDLDSVFTVCNKEIHGNLQTVWIHSRINS